MTEATLEELGTAFETWRKHRRNIREPVPKTLWEQVTRAIDTYGAHAVAQATKLQRSRIVERAKKGQVQGRKVPTYSRVSVSAPSVPGCPIAEVETAAGVKLRIFVQTGETLKLLSSLFVERGGS